MNLAFRMQICQAKKDLAENDGNVSLRNVIRFHLALTIGKDHTNHIRAASSTAILHHNPKLGTFNIRPKVPFVLVFKGRILTS